MSKMNYDLLMSVFEAGEAIVIGKIEEVVDDIFYEYNNSYDDDEKALCYKEIVNIANSFANQDCIIIGSDKEYHNLSVSYAREGYYDSACKILSRGISLNPYSADLLADFLNYSMNNSKMQSQCDEYYNRLINIPYSEWSWSAYSFSIDYLLNKRKKDIYNSEELKRSALKLADTFIINATEEHRDQAYVDKSTVYNAYNNRSEEIATLEKGIKATKRASKCRLKLADIEFQRGNYQEAIAHLEKCWRELSVQPKINKNYTFLLLALGKSSAFLENNQDLRSLDDKAKAELKSIYKYFNSVLEMKSEDIYNRTAKNIIKTFEIQTGVLNEDDNKTLDDAILDF